MLELHYVQRAPFETAFANETNAGTAKKQAVLAAVGVAATQAGQDWNTIQNDVSIFIDGVKDAYNQVATAFSKIVGTGH